MRARPVPQRASGESRITPAVMTPALPVRTRRSALGFSLKPSRLVLHCPNSWGVANDVTVGAQQDALTEFVSNYVPGLVQISADLEGFGAWFKVMKLHGRDVAVPSAVNALAAEKLYSSRLCSKLAERRDARKAAATSSTARLKAYYARHNARVAIVRSSAKETRRIRTRIVSAERRASQAKLASLKVPFLPINNSCTWELR